MKKIFKITKQNSNHRLDKFLTEHFPDYSRAYLQKQIKKGAVLVNPVRNLPKESEATQTKPQVKSPHKLKNKTTIGWISNGVNGEMKKPSFILKENDKVETNIMPSPEISLEPDPKIKLNIVYEDNDVIVIDKPAGLTVHPSETQKSDTLVNALLSHYPLLRNAGDDSLRPGIVHRLDKDTSGLMIIAKNNNSFEWLKRQFQERKVEKKYLALVVGAPKKPSGEIRTFITRSKSDPTKQKAFLLPSDEGRTGWGDELKINTSPKFPPRLRRKGIMREAITHYKIIRKFKDFTLLDAWPKTGRMHQIRVHLTWLGCPVAGDIKYGRKSLPRPDGLKRQFLHATELTITLPNNQKEIFKSRLPNDLQKILSALENNK